MRGVQSAVGMALTGLVVLLGALQLVAGLGAFGALSGLASGVGCLVVLAVGMVRCSRYRLSLADGVTLSRVVLSCGVAALVAQAFVAPPPPLTIAGLAGLAILLDGVDGRLARRSGTLSAFGARFDLEVDAFLILVLSVHVAFAVAWWVLAIGAARYVFVAFGLRYAWLRATLPPRYWAKVVAVIQGVALCVVTSQVLPRPGALAVLTVALGLLVESFANSIWHLWRLAHASHGGAAARPARGAAARPARGAAARPAGGAAGPSARGAAGPSARGAAVRPAAGPSAAAGRTLSSGHRVTHRA